MPIVMHITVLLYVIKGHCHFTNHNICFFLLLYKLSNAQQAPPIHTISNNGTRWHNGTVSKISIQYSMNYNTFYAMFLPMYGGGVRRPTLVTSLECSRAVSSNGTRNPTPYIVSQHKTARCHQITARAT